MPKVFDIEKYERYKARFETAHAAYLAASEDFMFERDAYMKSRAIFEKNFKRETRHGPYGEAQDLLLQAWQADPDNIPAIQKILDQALALAEDGTTPKNTCLG